MNKTLGKIEKLRGLLRKCYGVLLDKGAPIPTETERTMTSLSTAIEAIPQMGVPTTKLTPSTLDRYFSDLIAHDGYCRNGNLRKWWGLDGLDLSECTSFDDAFRRGFSVRWDDPLAGKVDVVADLTGLNVKSIKRLWRTFGGNIAVYARSLFIDMHDWDTSNLTSVFQAFNGTATQLAASDAYIDITGWRADKLVETGACFENCHYLDSLVGRKSISYVITNNVAVFTNLQKSMRFDNYNTSHPTKGFDRATLRAIINGVADLTGKDTQTLTFGALSDRLSTEDIAIATSKNWTIA